MAFVGKLLRSVRAGDKKLALNDPAFAKAPRLTVLSPAFEDGTPMAATYGGMKAAFPPISWSEVPLATHSFALIVQDIDVPLPSPIAHAVAYGIPAATRNLAERALPTAPAKGSPGVEIAMGSGIAGAAYAPPTPIPGHGPHRYVFQIFALDNAPQFSTRPGMPALLAAMRGHVLACGAVTGTYEN